MASSTERYTYKFHTPGEDLEEVIADTIQFVELVQQTSPEVLLFLDKSARPIAWLLMNVWRELELDQTRPEIKFVNFGREKATRSNGWDLDAYDYNLIPQWTEQLRRIFQIRSESSETFLDDKSVLIVDDFSNSGVTQDIVKDIVRPIVRSVESVAVYSSYEPYWLRSEALIGVQDGARHNLLSTRPSLPFDNTQNRELRAELRVIASVVAENILKS